MAKSKILFWGFEEIEKSLADTCSVLIVIQWIKILKAQKKKCLHKQKQKKRSLQRT